MILGLYLKRYGLAYFWYLFFRFHCLHNEMGMHPEHACVVTTVTTVLHNISTQKRIQLPRREEVMMEEMNPKHNLSTIINLQVHITCCRRMTDHCQ